MATNTEDEQPLPEIFERIRQRRNSPSPRNPYTSWHFNTADLIERQLREDGHRTWGFVIYRTTYADDADWAEFLRRVRFQMEDEFDRCKGRDILDIFTSTIFEDREAFESADSHAVRQHFLQWRERAPTLEQQPNDGHASTIAPGLSPRYRFAIQVDADALRSVVHDAPPPKQPGSTTKGWVKMINAAWQPGGGQQLQANLGGGLSLSMALPGSDNHDNFPPIEGLTEKYVGWMKVRYEDVMTSIYTDARDRNWWVNEYRRPPAVLGWPYPEC